MSIQVGDFVKVIKVVETVPTRDKPKMKKIGVLAQVQSATSENSFHHPYLIDSCSYGFGEEELEILSSANPIVAGDLAYVVNHPNPVKVKLAQVLQLVKDYDDWESEESRDDECNDDEDDEYEYGDTHEWGYISFRDTALNWQIVCYQDSTMEYGADDPLEKCYRVLTIMLAEEY
jgi:hypothetical protein